MLFQRTAITPLTPCLSPGVHSRYLALLFASSLFAQFETATLTGVVTDPAAALVPRVMVRLTNQATNVESVAVTDDDGRYTFTALRPGTYQLTASATGFKQYSSTDLILQVNQSARVDIQLTVAKYPSASRSPPPRPCSKQKHPAAAR